MANLKTNFLGYELKNPIGVSSCDFGGHEYLAKRVIDQGIGWLTVKPFTRSTVLIVGRDLSSIL